MMQKISILLIAFALLLSACAPTPTADRASASPSPSVKATATPSPTDSPALSLTPDTLTPGTPTVTPLPTIPTFTPTFDVRTIVTATPAPKVECPKENPSVKIDFRVPSIPDDVFNPQSINNEKVLNYLNNGGLLSNLVSVLQTSSMKKRLIYNDLTGDGIKDLLIVHFRGLGYNDFRIYSCVNGIYQSFSPFESDWAPLEHTSSILMVNDLNKNGILDIVISDTPALFIIEWQGTEFIPVMLKGSNSLSHPAEIKDTNHDGLNDVIFIGKDVHYSGFNEDVYAGAPWRDEIVVFSWNGNEYIQNPSEYTAPEYRFQAIQDADRFTLQHRYNQALDLYQNAIFDNKLNWWSPEMRKNELGILDANMQNQATPTPPAPDPTEYPRLAAYAYYRMLILHTFLGETEAAQVKYATLQEKFPSGNPGHPYVEMATDFWNTYQSSGQIYNACAAAIAYADAHPEILIPLGSDYHGWQSHIYTPVDVCPFR